MLSTYIKDVFEKNDSKNLADALDDIVSSIDMNGWSSAGIYCFWDPETNEILYIGLASDLSVRFKQHTGLISCKVNCCKINQIKDWFKSNTKLGYSILVQSTISQPEVSRNKKNLISSPFLDLYDPKEAIGITEGMLIEAEKLDNGTLPPWNKIGGNTSGKDKATEYHCKLSELFTNSNNKPDLCVAGRSIREISENPTFESYELFLHGVRQLMLSNHMGFTAAWKIVPVYNDEKQRIIEENYIPSLTEYFSNI